MRGVKTKNIINMPTVAELKARIRVHNRRNCIRLSQRKAALANDLARVKKGTGAGAGAGAAGAGAGAAGAGAAGAGMQQKAGKKKKRITPVLVSANVQPGGSAGFGNVGGGGGSNSSSSSTSSSSSSGGGGGGGGGNSVGQKNFKKQLKKQKKAYKKLKGMDANPELAF
jgi:hypothetical protein